MVPEGGMVRWARSGYEDGMDMLGKIPGEGCALAGSSVEHGTQS